MIYRHDREMTGRLTRKDYETILHHYGVAYGPKDKLPAIKKQAVDILSTKLCRCIKKVDSGNESRSIPICKRSVLHSKGLTDSGFSCKNKSLKLRHRKSLRARTIRRSSRL